MPLATFNSAAPIELQLTDFSCSVGAAFWCLRSLAEDVTQADLQAVMVPALVSPDLGLLDASGATIAQLLRDRFKLDARNVNPVSFDDVAACAGKQPLLMGGRNWHNGIGHWVAVRGFDGQQLVLANPGGTGPNFGQQALDRDAFLSRGTFSAVIITVASPTLIASARQFRIANTDGVGAMLRGEPSTSGASIRGLREGALVSGDEHAWRQVTDASGMRGWMANEFLAADNGQFRVVNTDGTGANLRSTPDTAAPPPVKLVPEGAELSGDEHAWRQVSDADGTPGWVADDFLVGA
jgi:hypothetical protein